MIASEEIAGEARSHFNADILATLDDRSIAIKYHSFLCVEGSKWDNVYAVSIFDNETIALTYEQILTLISGKQVS